MAEWKRSLVRKIKSGPREVFHLSMLEGSTEVFLEVERLDVRRGPAGEAFSTIGRVLIPLPTAKRLLANISDLIEVGQVLRPEVIRRHRNR